MAKKKRCLFISWENHTRTIGITRALNIELCTLIHNGKWFKRYPVLLYKTFHVLLKRNPDVLFVQNPSIVLSLFAMVIKYILQYVLIIDAHNEAIEPYINNNSIFKYASKLIIKKADVTIVTNSQLSDIVIQYKGNPFILPDRIPEVPEIDPVVLSNKFNLVLISTFAQDEPFDQVFEAVKDFSGNISLYVTGNDNKLDKQYKEQLAPNISFTGYLDKKKYWSLLNASDAIIDLTLMDNCLVCGAYEGIAVNKPLILSGNQATKDYFYKGVIYAENDSDSIRHAIKILIENLNNLVNDIKILKIELDKDWCKKINQFKECYLSY